MLHYEDRYNLIYTICMTSITIKDGLRKEFLKNGYDITIDNFAILTRLWQQDHLSQQKLCELTCKNKSNLTRILDTMEKKDMIKRISNPADRRSFAISLTDYSHSLKEDATKIAAEYSDRIFNKITKTDIENIHTIFAKINSVL